MIRIGWHDKAPWMDMYTRYPFDGFLIFFLFWDLALDTLHLAFYSSRLGLNI